MRVATWNAKQAVAPVLRPGPAWSWLEERVEPDVAVLTEAKIPTEGIPDGWVALHEPDGFGPRRRWGTVVGIYGLTVGPNGSSVGHGRWSVPPSSTTLLRCSTPIAPNASSSPVI